MYSARLVGEYFRDCEDDLTARCTVVDARFEGRRGPLGRSAFQSASRRRIDSGRTMYVTAFISAGLSDTQRRLVQVLHIDRGMLGSSIAA